MDNPGTSLFQGTDIKINNSQNIEEEEDIEDQRRRKEELQDLLTAALDDFNYDESTVNSSTNISIASFDEVQHAYKQASEPNEQLKMLYDIRLKELNNIKEEYSSYRTEKNKEINKLKNKLILLEAEIRQLKISQKNSEDLLVEKTSNIVELNNALNSKDMQIKDYEKTIEKFQFEVCSYQSTINELQMKLHGDKNPFNLGAKKFNSEELQKAHQEQIVRLETLLNDQIKANKILEREKTNFQHELQNIIEQKDKLESEDQNTIKALTKTLESAQQQCKDLLDVVDMLTKENKHLQERIDGIHKVMQEEANYQLQPLDNNTLMKNIEKLKKMFLDKSIQIDSLNSKLKFYENDIQELLEYRQLKCDVYKQEFQQCENKDHTKCLLLMQNDLQNYRRTIEDKNQQILTLNSTNRDLQEKIEEMLLQTRNDIQNLSHKYSLPQLEQMTLELKNAEEKVQELQERLNKSEERRLLLVQKLEKNEKTVEKELRKEFESQLVNLKNSSEKDKINFENQITKLQKELEISAAEIKNLKQFTENLIDENAKLKLEKVQSRTDKSLTDSHENVTIKTEYEQLKEQLNQVMAHLQKNKIKKETPATINSLRHDMEEFLLSLGGRDVTDLTDLINLIKEKVEQWKEQLGAVTLTSIEKMDSGQENYEQTVKKLQKASNKIKVLEEALDDLKSAKTIAEGEKCTYQFQVRDYENQLEHASKTIKHLEHEVANLTGLLKEKEEIISQLDQHSLNDEIEELKTQLNIQENTLKTCEEEKKELNELLQEKKLQLEELREEVLRLQKEVAEVNEKAVRRNLEKELKEAENHLEQSRIEDGDVYESEYFKRCLQAEILKNELKLREDLQQEYLRKIKEVEAKYVKVCTTTTESYKEQIEKLKNQEVRYREHLSKILAECARKIDEFESEKQDLISQMNCLQAEYDEYKKHVAIDEKNYRQLIKRIQMEAEKKVDKWKNWSKEFVSNCLKIETINKTSRDRILHGMKNFDSEIAAHEKSYKEKVRKYLKNEIR